MQDGAEIGAKVNKHGAKSLETQATSDNVQYDKRAWTYSYKYRPAECAPIAPYQSRLSPAPELTALVDYRDYVHYIPGTQHPCLSPSTAPQASLTPPSGIQDDDC